MLVLGIDPGTAITGYGFVRETTDGKLDAIDYGVIETASKLSPGERLLELYQALNKRISLHKPVCGAVERLFFQKNVTTALSVGQARGVAILALAEVGIPIFEYTPMEVKLAVSGYGSAQKEQVQTMVKALLSLEEIPEPDDAADALAIAICHFHNQKFQQILSQNQ